jgi:NAD(P)-dependent dehydrogenase (short-subunit alcohol dehydrogenase family)
MERGVAAREGRRPHCAHAFAARRALDDDARTKLTDRIALKRLGTPDDIANAVVFLASEQASYITGTVLNVSGGLYT